MLEMLTILRPLLEVLLFVLFSSILCWVYAPRRRVQIEECGRIPLRDDEP